MRSGVTQVVWALGGAAAGWGLVAMQGRRFDFEQPLMAYVIAAVLGGVLGFVMGRGLDRG